MSDARERAVRPAVPFWTCICRCQNLSHRPYCFWCGMSRAEADAPIEGGGR